jgi:hypothetical protein
VIALLYLVSSAGVATAGGKRDNLDFTMDSGWRIAYHGQSRSMNIIEYVPKGDDFENWTELFTYQNGAKNHFDHSPEKMLNAEGEKGKGMPRHHRMDCNRTK